MLNPTQHDAWTGATMAAVLALRTWAIRCGTSPLKAWDAVADRARMATSQSTSVQTWLSTMCRSLRIGVVDPETSRIFIELAAVVGTDVDAWLTWLEDEQPFVFALAREHADRQKAQRGKKPKTKAET